MISRQPLYMSLGVRGESWQLGLDAMSISHTVQASKNLENRYQGNNARKHPNIIFSSFHNTTNNHTATK